MNEILPRKKLLAHLIASSVSKEWVDIKKEWKLYYQYDSELTHCICGARISKVFVLKNETRTISIGSTCACYFDSTCINALRVCLKTLEEKKYHNWLGIRKHILDFALENDFITSYEHERYTWIKLQMGRENQYGYMSGNKAQYKEITIRIVKLMLSRELDDDYLDFLKEHCNSTRKVITYRSKARNWYLRQEYYLKNN